MYTVYKQTNDSARTAQSTEKHGVLQEKPQYTLVLKSPHNCDSETLRASRRCSSEYLRSMRVINESTHAHRTTGIIIPRRGDEAKPLHTASAPSKCYVGTSLHKTNVLPSVRPGNERELLLVVLLRKISRFSHRQPRYRNKELP